MTIGNYGDNDTIRDLKAEHGALLVDGMIATGKRLLFSSSDGELQTIFERKHLIALQYALKSMDIHDYATERYGLKLLFHFEEEDVKRLLAEQQFWLEQDKLSA